MPDRNKNVPPVGAPRPEKMVSDFYIPDDHLQSEDISVDGHQVFIPASFGADRDQHRMGSACFAGDGVGLSF